MDISVVRQRLRETIERAKRRAAERRVRNDDAARAYSSFLELVAVPPGEVIAIGPVVAPDGTVAVSNRSEFTVKAAATPLNVTAVLCDKLTPLMDTVLPMAPLVGENFVISGGATSLNTDPQLSSQPNMMLPQVVP